MYIGHSALADAQHLELPDGVSKARLHIARSVSAVFPTERSPVPSLQCPDWFPLLLPAKRQIVDKQNPGILKCIRQQGSMLESLIQREKSIEKKMLFLRTVIDNFHGQTQGSSTY